MNVYFFKTKPFALASFVAGNEAGDVNHNIKYFYY